MKEHEMKNVATSTQIGCWHTRPASTDVSRPEDPVERYRAAKKIVVDLRTEVQRLVDRARAAGFELAEALAIPAIKQALLAARAALQELAAAQALLIA
jgi:hypothetical protein